MEGVTTNLINQFEAIKMRGEETFTPLLGFFLEDRYKKLEQTSYGGILISDLDLIEHFKAKMTAFVAYEWWLVYTNGNKHLLCLNHISPFIIFCKSLP